MCTSAPISSSMVKRLVICVSQSMFLLNPSFSSRFRQKFIFCMGSPICLSFLLISIFIYSSPFYETWVKHDARVFSYFNHKIMITN